MCIVIDANYTIYFSVRFSGSDECCESKLAQGGGCKNALGCFPGTVLNIEHLTEDYRQVGGVWPQDIRTVVI